MRSMTDISRVLTTPMVTISRMMTKDELLAGVVEPDGVGQVRHGRLPGDGMQVRRSAGRVGGSPASMRVSSSARSRMIASSWISPGMPASSGGPLAADHHQAAVDVGDAGGTTPRTRSSSLCRVAVAVLGGDHQLAADGKFEFVQQACADHRVAAVEDRAAWLRPAVS